MPLEDAAVAGASGVKMVPWRLPVDDNTVVLVTALAVPAAVASGRCDEPLVFLAAALAFGLAVSVKVPAGEVDTLLRDLAQNTERTDLSGWVRSKIPLAPLSSDREAILASFQVLAGALALSILVRRSLARYSPALCVVLYCSCVTLIIEEKISDLAMVQTIVLACMVALSLVSNHILRLHVAASVFCCCLIVSSNFKAPPDSNVTFAEALDLDLRNPLLVSFCLVVGLATCVAHDVIVRVVIGPLAKLAHLTYIVLATFITVDTAIEAAFRLPAPAVMARWRSWLWSTPLGAHLGGQNAPVAAAAAAASAATKVESATLMLTDTRGFTDRLNFALGPRAGLLSYEGFATLAPPLCAAFAAIAVVRRLIAPSMRWCPGRLKEAAGTALGMVVGIGAMMFRADGKDLQAMCKSPALLTVISFLLYAQIARVTETKENAPKPKWYTMVYWHDAFTKDPEPVAPAPLKFASISQPVPDSVLSPEDDFRLRDTLKELERRMKAANGILNLVDAADAVNNGELTVGWKDTRKSVLQRIKLVGKLSEAAKVAEAVAAQLREIATDAQSEWDLFVNIVDMSRKQRLKGRAKAPQVEHLARQAGVNFRWLTKELEAAEVRADTLTAELVRHTRIAAHELALLRFAPQSEGYAGISSSERTVFVNRASDDLARKAAWVVGDGEVDFQIQQAANKLPGHKPQQARATVEPEGTAPQRAQSSNHGQADVPPSSSVTLENDSGAATSSLVKQMSTPFEEAMKSKKLPDIPPGDDLSVDGESAPSLNDSERSRRRRRWWQVSLFSSLNSKAAKSPKSATSAASSPSRSKRSLDPMGQTNATTPGGTASSIATKRSTPARRRSKRRSPSE